MPTFRTARVAEILKERRGLQRLRLDDGSRAYALTDAIGPCGLGDDVIVNTTAVELGLGTGGWHVVHWNLARSEFVHPGPGHIMKLRYTGLQLDTGAAAEFDAPRAPLGGRPVVIGSLHSQLGVVLGVLAGPHRPRVGYVMTDGAALPIALSDLVADAEALGLLDLTITAGHAFGGALEAVTVADALELAAGAAMEVVVVAMGPGVVGTGTRLGTTAIEVASVIDLVDALGGHAIVAARASEADGRARHRGLSHHTVTALELCRASATIALPDHARYDALSAAIPDRHRVVRVEIPDVAAGLADAGLAVTTMGRGPSEDPWFFEVSAAAAVAAARAASPDGTVPGR